MEIKGKMKEEVGRGRGQMKKRKIWERVTRWGKSKGKRMKEGKERGKGKWRRREVGKGERGLGRKRGDGGRQVKGSRNLRNCRSTICNSGRR